MNSFKTPKGTELPILNLRGKDYLQVAQRLVWFIEEKPEWRIETEIFFHDTNRSICRATIKDQSGNIMAQATKSEDVGGFGDHLEKSETGAVGRALAMRGYGTQFCADELDEGARVVDSPQEKRPQPVHQSAPKPAQKAQPSAPKASVPFAGIIGDYKIKVGKKYNGVALKDIQSDDLFSYENWLRDEAQKKGKALTGDWKECADMIEKYLSGPIT